MTSRLPQDGHQANQQTARNRRMPNGLAASLLIVSYAVACLLLWMAGVSGYRVLIGGGLLGFVINTWGIELVARRWFPGDTGKPQDWNAPLSLDEARSEAFWWLDQPELFRCSPASGSGPIVDPNLPEAVRELFKRYSEIQSLDRYKIRIAPDEVRESRFHDGFLCIGTYGKGTVEICVQPGTGKVLDLIKRNRRDNLEQLLSYAYDSIFHFIVLVYRMEHPDRVMPRTRLR